MYRMLCMLIKLLSDWRVGFTINQYHFWIWAMFGVVLRNYLKKCRWMKLWTTIHAFVWNVVSHTTSITDNHKLYIYHICNNFSNLYVWFISPRDNSRFMLVSSLVKGWCIWSLDGIGSWCMLEITEHWRWVED